MKNRCHGLGKGAGSQPGRIEQRGTGGEGSASQACLPREGCDCCKAAGSCPSMFRGTDRVWVTSEKDDPKGWVMGTAAGGSNDHEGRKVVWLWTVMAAKEERS